MNSSVLSLPEPFGFGKSSVIDGAISPISDTGNETGTAALPPPMLMMVAAGSAPGKREAIPFCT